MRYVPLVVLFALGCSAVATESPAPPVKGDGGQANSEGFACGQWLEQIAAGPGFVTIRIKPHITCGTDPIKSIVVTPDNGDVLVIYVGTTVFQVHAPAGRYVVTYTEDCPPCCSVCASITVDVSE